MSDVVLIINLNFLKFDKYSFLLYTFQQLLRLICIHIIFEMMISIESLWKFLLYYSQIHQYTVIESGHVN